jgi:hypothetical protein
LLGLRDAVGERLSRALLRAWTSAGKATRDDLLGLSVLRGPLLKMALLLLAQLLRCQNLYFCTSNASKRISPHTDCIFEVSEFVLLYQ